MTDAETCDTLERDVLDLAWEELDLTNTLEHNKAKYLIMEGNMHLKLFNRIKDILIGYQA